MSSLEQDMSSEQKYIKFIYKSEKEKTRFKEAYEKALLLFNRMQIFLRLDFDSQISSHR
jgi:hypothetical protein